MREASERAAGVSDSGESGRDRDGQRPRRGRGRLFVAAGFVAVAIGAAAWFVGPVAFPNAGGGSAARDNEIRDGSPAAGPITESGFPVSELDSVRDQYDRVAASVVRVGGSAGHGTGWLLDQSHVVTNWHNVINFPLDAVPVPTFGGDTILGTVIATDEFDDIAIVVLGTPTRLPSLPVAASAARVGDPVFFVGHPGVMGDWVIGVGVVSSAAAGGPPNFLRSTLPVVPGASGSPMLNMAGEVVALISGCMEAMDPNQGARGDGPPVDSTVPGRRAVTDNCGGTEIESVMDFVERILGPR